MVDHVFLHLRKSAVESCLETHNVFDVWLFFLVGQYFSSALTDKHLCQKYAELYTVHTSVMTRLQLSNSYSRVVVMQAAEPHHPQHSILVMPNASGLLWGLHTVINCRTLYCRDIVWEPRTNITTEAFGSILLLTVWKYCF